MVSYTVKGATLTLSEVTSIAWDDIGPEGSATRREVREDASILSDRLGRQIEVHSHDGITLDAIGTR